MNENIAILSFSFKEQGILHTLNNLKHILCSKFILLHMAGKCPGDLLLLSFLSEMFLLLLNCQYLFYCEHNLFNSLAI